MSSEAARALSISDLLRVLDEKLNLECTRIQASLGMPTTSLESDIAGLEAGAHAVLRRMSSLRNALQPVNRLPPEILSLIAQGILDDSDLGDISFIIPLTHVCRYWRDSLISAPCNWARVSNHSDFFAALSLERSKAAPLKISLNMLEVSDRFPGILTPYAQNIISLRLSDLADFEDLTRVFPGFPHSMPNLRSLDISLIHTAWDWWFSVDLFEPFSPILPDLRTLTELSFRDHQCTFPLDALLTMLEQNRFLDHVQLFVHFVNSALRDTRRQVPISNRIRRLSVTFAHAEDARAFIFNIPLQKGAHLELNSLNSTVGLRDTLSSTFATHLENLSSLTHMDLCEEQLKLSGPNGSLSFFGLTPSDISLEDLPLLSFDKIRELRFRDSPFQSSKARVSNPSFFPALETIVVEHDISVSGTLAIWLSSPMFSPSLKTFAFLNCVLSEEFMGTLTRFAFDRHYAGLTCLHRVLIVDRIGGFPSLASILGLRVYVNVVETQIAGGLPMDLTR